MPSSRFSTLLKHLEDLRKHLLPDPFLATGIYPDASLVQTRTVAFVALAHAEFEAYFEDRVIEIAVAAREAFHQKAQVCRSVVCLLGFVDGAGKGPSKKLTSAEQDKEKLGKWLSEIDIKSRVSFATSSFIRYVKEDNHGIKEKDLAAVLIPIGVPYYAFGPLVVAGLNTLGAVRGEYVHGGRARYVTKSLDPKSQYEDLHQLTMEVEKIDIELDKLLAEAS